MMAKAHLIIGVSVICFLFLTRNVTCEHVDLESTLGEPLEGECLKNEDGGVELQCQGHSAFVLLDSTSNDEVNVITLKQGRAQGKTMKSFNGKTFTAFLGINFGKVTKRFTNSEPADSWTGVLDATKDAPPCKQFDAMEKFGITGQEDCLNLNVYTPKFRQGNSHDKYPVIVFFHGGGFAMGEPSSTMYGPERYMNKDIVLVLPSYRLGAFGFLSTNDQASPGNYGLRDQVLALQWVHDNIEVFGGDPDQVTISGVSAGSGAVGFHLVSPLSKGLFHRAIAQSGPVLGQWALEKDPLRMANRIAEVFNCPKDDTTAMVECLRKVDSDALIMALNFSGIPSDNTVNLVPVIEHPGNGGFLTEHPITLFQEGRFNKVPVIMGFTAEEYAPLIAMGGSALPPVTDMENTDWERLFWILTTIHQKDKTKLKEAIDFYFKDANFSDISDIRLREVQLADDVLFNSGTVKTVSMIAEAGLPAYMYILDYIPDDLATSNYSGKPDVVHGNDLLFIFNWTTFGTVKDNNFTGEALEVSNTVLDLWYNFAKTGDPNPSGSIHWSPSPKGSIHYLNITKPEFTGMKNEYRTKFMEFWNERLYNVNYNSTDAIWA